MRNIIILNRTIKFVSFLYIFCCLISCDTTKNSNRNDSVKARELAMESEIIGSEKDVISFSNSTKLDSNDKDTHILLTIDTKTINQNNISAKVVFSDDRSDPIQNPGDPASFTSVVNKNMKVYWSGVAKDTTSGDEVAVLGIYRKPDGGAEILESLAKDPNKNGVVVGKVKNKNITGFEYYSVEFRINEDTLRTFLVDPKLKMMQ